MSQPYCSWKLAKEPAFFDSASLRSRLTNLDAALTLRKAKTAIDSLWQA